MALTIKEVAQIVGGIVDGDTGQNIQNVAKIEEAGSGDITFVANRKYVRHLKETRATAVLIPQDLEVKAGSGEEASPGKSGAIVIPAEPEIQSGADESARAAQVKSGSDVIRQDREAGSGPILIRVADPYFAFLKIVVALNPPKPLIESGIHESAVIGVGSDIGENISIGARVVIGRDCSIGSGTTVMPGVVIGDGAKIGSDCLIHANCSIREKVIIGNRVVLQDNVVIGGDGFGFAPVDGVYHKIPQIGTVVIEDDVEIGAGTTVDRATLGETRIKKGAKLDNLIQIAHNCVIGENTVIAAQVGLSGSTIIGDQVRVGGQAGFSGHLEVGDGASIGGKAGVLKDVPSGIMVSGFPARPHLEDMRKEAAIAKLPKTIKEIRELKKRLAELEEQLRRE